MSNISETTLSNINVRFTESTAVCDAGTGEHVVFDLEAKTASGQRLEFSASSVDPAEWNICVTGPAELMREIFEMIRQKAQPGTIIDYGAKRLAEIH